MPNPITGQTSVTSNTRQRNWVLLLILLAIIALFFAITIIKMA